MQVHNVDGSKEADFVEDVASALATNLIHKYPEGPPSAEEKQLKKWLSEIMETLAVRHESLSTTTTAVPESTDSSCTTTSSSTSTSKIELIMKEAVSVAISRWKSNASILKEQKGNHNNKKKHSSNNDNEKQQKKSFSLFDQLQSYGEGLPIPISVQEDLVEQSETLSEEEKLKILKRIDHIDEIIMDWTEIIVPMLQKGLKSNLSEDYVQLQWKWYNQLRCSNDQGYYSIQYDICWNILNEVHDRVVQVVTASGHIVCSSSIGTGNDPNEHELEFTKEAATEPEIETICHLLSIWKNMWLDLMHQNLFSYEMSRKMGLLMLLFMRNLLPTGQDGLDAAAATASSSYHCQHLSFLPVHVLLGIIDPTAKWVTSWIAYIEPKQLVSILYQSQVLPDIINRCSLGKRNTSATPIETSEEVSVIVKMTGLPMFTVDQIIKRYSLCLLSTILTTTRVKSFPWNIMTNNINNEAGENSPLMSTPLLVNSNRNILETQEQQHQLQSEQEEEDCIIDIAEKNNKHISTTLNIFLSFLSNNQSTETPPSSSQKSSSSLVDDDTMAIRMCTDAVETILWGCIQNKTLFTTLLQKVEAQMNALTKNRENSIALLMHKIVGRVKRAFEEL